MFMVDVSLDRDRAIRLAIPPIERTMKRVAAKFVTLEQSPEFLVGASAVALAALLPAILARGVTGEARLIDVLDVQPVRFAPAAEQIGLELIERLVPNHVRSSV